MRAGKILILDIKNDNKQLNKQRLRNWGHEVVQYEYDQNTHYQIIAEKPDLIILQSNGALFYDILKCCQHLKSIIFVKDIPLVVQITSEDYLNKRELLFLESVEDCIAEPVVHSELKQKFQTG